MEKFVHTPDFKKLNVGFALDEGMASPNNEFLLYYGERSIWRKCLQIKKSTEFTQVCNLLDSCALGLHNT